MRVLLRKGPIYSSAGLTQDSFFFFIVGKSECLCTTGFVAAWWSHQIRGEIVEGHTGKGLSLKAGYPTDNLKAIVFGFRKIATLCILCVGHVSRRNLFNARKTSKSLQIIFTISWKFHSYYKHSPNRFPSFNSRQIESKTVHFEKQLVLRNNLRCVYVIKLVLTILIYIFILNLFLIYLFNWIFIKKLHKWNGLFDGVYSVSFEIY